MERLLNIQPQELSFLYELNKQTACSIRLSNGTNKRVAFKVMTTNPKNYCVRPNVGIVLPRSTSDLIVTMAGPKAHPTEVKCEDKFLIKSVVASPCATKEDAVWKLFDKEAGSQVQEFELGVIYTFPFQLPSSVAETSVFSCASGAENTNSSDPKMGPCTPALPIDASFGRKLIDVRPSELKFDIELKKDLSCLLQLSNMTSNHVFFKVKTTDREKCCVQPNIGIVLPRSTCDVIVWMKAQKKFPLERQCNDKFLIQSIVGSPASSTKEVTPQMFDETGRFVEEFKLGVVYSFPSIRQSPTYEPSEACSSLEEPQLQHSTPNDPEKRKGPWSCIHETHHYFLDRPNILVRLDEVTAFSMESDHCDSDAGPKDGTCLHSFLAPIFGRRANVSIT